MATRCTTSSVLALPTVLRNVFRAELASDLSAVFRNRPCTPRSSLPPQYPPYTRRFSSVSVVHYAQNPESERVTPAVNANATGPSQPSTNATDLGAFKRHAAPKHQRRPKDSNGTTDKKKHARGSSNSKGQPAKSKTGPGKKKPEHWQVQKEALKKKFPNGWNPLKKLSPDALEGIRHLHATAPDHFTTAVLAEQFRVSPEAIRRILKSRWRATEEEAEERRKRWANRHERIWARMVQLGLRPPTKSSTAVADSKVLYDEIPRE